MKKLSHSFAKVSHSYKKGVALVGMRHLKPKSVVSVSAMLDIHVKKISLKLLFLSDISLFPFVRQQITVLA